MAQLKLDFTSFDQQFVHLRYTYVLIRFLYFISYNNMYIGCIFTYMNRLALA